MTKTQITMGVLRHVDATAQTGSFSEAAKICGISQPAISASISRLEQRLGARLFSRSHSGVLLTHFGSELIPKISRIVEEMEILSSEARRLAAPRGQTLIIGVSPLANKDLLQYIEACTKDIPEFDGIQGVTFREEEPDVLENWLNHGTVDAAITSKICGISSCSTPKIYSEDLFYIPSDYSGEDLLSENLTFEMDELSAEPLILCRRGCGLTQHIEQIYRLAGKEIIYADVDVTSCVSLSRWAGKGFGATILPRSEMPKDILGRRIVDENCVPFTMSFYLNWNKATSHADILGRMSSLLLERGFFGY